MGSVNKAIVVGNLGIDPQLKKTASGNSVCNFSLATNEAWTGKDGTKNERTEWHRIVVWGPQADACAKYLAKGRQVYVEGRIQTRQWTDKEGNERYTTEIVANQVTFLGGAGEGGGSRSNSAPSKPAETFADEDIPF